MELTLTFGSGSAHDLRLLLSRAENIGLAKKFLLVFP